MSDELIDAHRHGRVEVTIGRAARLHRARCDRLGDGRARVRARALGGKKAQTIGRPDTLHSYSYVPDIGRNLVLLGSRDDAFGRVWHLPNPDTRTTREIITDIYAALDQPARIAVLNKPMLRAIGLFNRNVR